MSFNHRVEKDICIIMVDSDIAMQRGKELHVYFESQIQSPAYKGFIIDMIGAGYIDSRGISVLTNMVKECKSREIPISFCHLNQKVSNIFRIFQLNTIFTIHETEEQALKGMFS